MLPNGKSYSNVRRMLLAMLAISLVLMLAGLAGSTAANAWYCDVQEGEYCQTLFAKYHYHCENCLINGQWTGWICSTQYVGLCM